MLQMTATKGIEKKVHKINDTKLREEMCDI